MKYKNYELFIVISKYQNNDNLALLLETKDGEPFGRLTTNIDSLPDTWCAIDTNNFPDATDLIEEYELGMQVGTITSGFCVYPIYEMNMVEVNRYVRNN